MYMCLFALCLSLSLIQTTVVAESPVFFHETPVRNSHQCRLLCNVVKTCQGTVFNLKNRTCSLFSTQFLQKVPIGKDFNTMEYEKEGFVYQCKGRRGCGRSGICVTTEDGESSTCIPPPTCARPGDLATLKTPDVGTSPMGTEVTYICSIGYNRTSGEGLSVCKFDQQWSIQSLKCQIIDCGKPPEIDNMVIGPVSTTTYDSSIRYSCVLGFYATSGTGHSVCTETGDWSTPTLVCKIVDCGFPLPIARMDLGAVTNTTYSFDINYSCSIGYYKASGSGHSTCLQIRAWSTPSLVCKVVDCGNPPEYPTMSAGSVSTTVYDSQALYSCLLGYSYVSGDGHSVCQQSRVWSTPTLVCEIKDCKQPPAVAGMGIATHKPTTYGSVLTYSCSLGTYPFSGSGTITCQESGKWTSHTLVCEDIPGLLMKRNLGLSTDTLTCRTVTESYSESSGPPSLSCYSDEMLTDCSAKGNKRLTGTNGIQMVVVGGKPHCLVRYEDNTGVATARCCKVNNLKCEYIEAGPSLPKNDAKIQVPCYKGFKTFGCNAYTEDGQLDGDFISSKKCYGQLGGGSSKGAYANGVCCSAPGLRCEWRKITNINRVNNEMIATCPQGYVLIGCNGKDSWLYARGSYIEGDECRLATTHAKSEVHITCCNATMTL